MINLILESKLLDLNEPVKQIYVDSFPVDERREWHDLNQILKNLLFFLRLCNFIIAVCFCQSQKYEILRPFYFLKFHIVI